MELQKPPRAYAAHLYCPSRQRRQEFFGEFRKTAEIGNFNLWFPISSPEPAAASGCRLSLPAASGSRPCRPFSPLRERLPFQGSLYAAPVPPLKGEVTAKQAVGFMGAEFGNSDLWFPNSSIEPAAASGTGYYPAGGSKWNRALPGDWLLKVYYSPPVFCSLFLECVV